MQNKKHIRKQVLAKLSAISPSLKKERDELLFKQIKSKLINREISSIHCFLSTNQEFNTKPIIKYCWNNQIKVFVPKIEKKRVLSHWEIKADTKTKPGPLEIPEPINTEPMKVIPDLIFTPGLAFTLFGDRLGYGGGYYDQFLASYPHSEKWAACYPEALFDDLPQETHDIKVDRVFTIK